MNDMMKNINVVKIVYFTGTGSTTRVADCFEKSFENRGLKVIKSQLKAGQTLSSDKEDLLVVLYSVHACNAPEPVYDWIESISSVEKTPAIVISVSGGGEVTPNKACRVSCIKRLQGKGYQVVYEKMIVMPSNWIMQTIDGLAIRLLEILPSRVENVVNDVLSGVICRTKPDLFNRFLSRLGELEKLGARSFGKKIKVSQDCNGCGLCERNCPGGNIVIENHRPTFKNKCILCLNCIYGCPNKALSPGSLKFIIVKEGYNLKEVEKRMNGVEPAPVEDLAKGYWLKGVKEYLLDSETQKNDD